MSRGVTRNLEGRTQCGGAAPQRKSEGAWLHQGKSDGAWLHQTMVNKLSGARNANCIYKGELAK